MSSHEFTEWMAYHRHNPFTESRADLRAAIIAHTVYSSNMRKGMKPMKVADFVPTFDAATPEDKKEGLIGRVLGAFGLG